MGNLLAHNNIIIELVFAFICAGCFVYFARPKALFSKKAKDRPLRSTGNELGSGDLAQQEHIKQWTTPKDTLDTKLPIENLTGSNGAKLKKGDLVIPREERNRHVLIIAKTGSGKTTKLILPVLYNDCMCPVRSTIVIDSKPEMWDKLAAMTNHFNPEKNILLFNPLDTLRSLSWNILGKIEDDTDAKLIANSVITATDSPSSKSDSPFFRNNALSLLNAIFVGQLSDPNEKLSMPRTHELVHSGMQNLCDWLEAHPAAIRNSRTFVELARSGSQNADTIMSELGMRLAAWDLKAIRSTTFKEELDLDSLIERPTLFIVELRESEIEMLRPLANVIVVEILRYLTKKAESCPGHSLPRPVSLVIDEFASALGRLPDIHVKLNTLRSRNVSIVAAIQSIAQIKANYQTDADSVLAGFSTKILMPALDFQDAEWASKETGQMTVRFATQRTGTNKKISEFLANRSIDSSEQVQQRAVLTPDEIGRPADNRATFFMPNTPVFQGHLIPFYKVKEVLDRFNKFEGIEFNIRKEPIQYEENVQEPSAPTQSQSTISALSLEDQLKLLEEIKPQIGWQETTGAARQWWEAFEKENLGNIVLIYKLAQELQARDATITDFFLSFIYSNSTNIEDNLAFIERMKKEGKSLSQLEQEEKEKKVESSQAQAKLENEVVEKRNLEPKNQIQANVLGRVPIKKVPLSEAKIDNTYLERSLNVKAEESLLDNSSDLPNKPVSLLDEVGILDDSLDLVEERVEERRFDYQQTEEKKKKQAVTLGAMMAMKQGENVVSKSELDNPVNESRTLSGDALLKNKAEESVNIEKKAPEKQLSMAELRKRALEKENKSEVGKSEEKTGNVNASSSVPNKLDLVRKLQDKKRALGWFNLDEASKKWWEAFEKANQQNLEYLLNVLIALEQRKLNIIDFLNAYQSSRAKSVEDVFKYIDSKVA